MSVDTKKRLILRNLLHINSSVDTRRQRANRGLYIQVSTDLWPVTPRPRTRGTGAALPFQRRVQRAIGHIAGAQVHSSRVTKERPQVTAICTVVDNSQDVSPQKVTLRYRR